MQLAWPKPMQMTGGLVHVEVSSLRFSPLQGVDDNVHLPGSLLPSGAAAGVLADPG